MYIHPPTIHIYNLVKRGFLRRAWKHFPLEYMELLYGLPERDKLHIAAAIHASQKATTGSVTLTDEVEVEELVEEAKEHGLVVVGTWHTHPMVGKERDMRDAYAHLSMTDHVEGAMAGEMISAVSTLWTNHAGRRHSRTNWWVPQGKIKVTSQ